MKEMKVKENKRRRRKNTEGLRMMKEMVPRQLPKEEVAATIYTENLSLQLPKCKEMNTGCSYRAQHTQTSQIDSPCSVGKTLSHF